MGNDLPSPLALLMLTMHKKWLCGDEAEAIALAKAIAPYVHAKAATQAATTDLAAMRDDQLNDLCEAGPSGTQPADGDPE